MAMEPAREVLFQWEGDLDQAVTYPQDALALAQEIGLPGEDWPILGMLGALYAHQGQQVNAP